MSNKRSSTERDALGKRVFESTVFGGRPAKLTSWCDAAAVIETLEGFGYRIVGPQPRDQERDRG